MEKIADVLRLKHPQFNTISSDSTVYEGLNKMCCENVDYLIILEKGQFAGLLTEHDIAGKLLVSEQQLQQIPVREFMNRSLPVATQDNTVDYAMQLLEHYNAKYLAVYEGFAFKGILSVQDLMRHTLHQRQVQVPLGNAAEEDRYTWHY